MKMENERLCIEISEHGAEVTRIYDKKERDGTSVGGKSHVLEKDIPRSFSRT